MLSLANIIRKIKSPYYYNIGFVHISPEELVAGRGFGKRKINWLSHPFADRWFADPFILSADHDKIEVLAEEKIYGNPGSLVRLTVSPHNFKLIDRTEILKLDTHLSYPNPIRIDGRVYVYPENSQSGKFNIYRYEENKGLEFEKGLLPYPLNDASIFFDKESGKYFLIATNTDIDPHGDTLLFTADSILGSWTQVGETPIIYDKRYARPGGNFFEVKGKLYRPAQDCADDYGKCLHIMEVQSVEPWREKEIFEINPTSFKYSKGLHTLNFHSSGLAVIDGNGYAYPVLGRIFGGLLETMIHPKKK